MLLMMILGVIVFLISIFFMIISLSLSKKDYLNQEKSSPFECGFDPLSFNRLPFSVQFFLISLVFIVFDIEIALLVPVVFMINKFSLAMIYSVLFFLLILLFGLYYEYIEQSIDWKL